MYAHNFKDNITKLYFKDRLNRKRWKNIVKNYIETQQSDRRTGGRRADGRTDSIKVNFNLFS
jgi:hypothetical protein